MRSLDQLDGWLAARMRNWASRIAGVSRGPEILEIRRDILNDVRDHIELKEEGKNVFPYNTILINIAAETSQRTTILQAFQENDDLEQTVLALLSEAGCPVPELQVMVSLSEDEGLVSQSRPFRIEYLSSKPLLASGTTKSRPKAKLIVISGEADASEYTFNADRLNVGRLKEVFSDKEGMRRRNDVAFAESETTVSREHAFIHYDSNDGKFRLYDCLSQRGTNVFRDGRRFDVPKRATRGFQLRPGDEIHLGAARLRFETEDS